MNKVNKVIFGIGREGKKMLQNIDTSDVLCIVDNDERLWGTSYQGIPIVSLNDLSEKKDEVEIIVSSTKYEKEISQQLEDKGFHFISNTKYYINLAFEGKKKKRIILLNTHVFTNVGDHTIVIAEYYFFKKFFPTYELIEISALLCKNELDYIKKFVCDEDILIISGGGYLGSLWMEYGEDNVRSIIKCFPDNRIIVMPQTMFFEDSEDGRKKMIETQHIFGMHNKLSICMRDKVSYNLANKILPRTVNKYLIPDMVALMDRSYEIYSRKGCVFCFREDKECVVTAKEKNILKKYIEKKNVEIIDFSMYSEEMIDQGQRMDMVNEKIVTLQKSRLVITDRLHCMLLCAICGTPCIALDNLSKKISGTYEWICYLEYIKLRNENGDVFGDIDKLLTYENGIYDNSALQDKYQLLFNVIAHPI